MSTNFLPKIGKMGKNNLFHYLFKLVKRLFLFIYLEFFKCLLNLGKYIKLNFSHSNRNLGVVSQNWITLNAEYSVKTSLGIFFTERTKWLFWRIELLHPELIFFGCIQFYSKITLLETQTCLHWETRHEITV